MDIIMENIKTYERIWTFDDYELQINKHNYDNHVDDY